jgi:hypothetical protein
MRKQTYTIPFAEARREYLNNDAFREVLNTGCFIYVENSYVLNSAEYVAYGGNNEPVLTEYARAHLDGCALLFEEREIIKYSGSVTRGADGQEAAVEIRNTTSYPALRQKKGLTEDIQRLRKAMLEQFELQAAHQKTCWQRIFEIITNKGTTTSGQFQNKTGLVDKVFNRAKNNALSMPEMKTVITVAAAYDLDLSTMEELLRLAGHSLSPASKEHHCYRFILTTMFGRGMQAKNEFLVEEGFEPLGSKPQKKQRKL